MSEPRLSISSRRSQDSRSGASISHGRGGAGNIGKDDTEYVDGGLYATQTPGTGGAGYSGGRGGAGNIARPSGDRPASDRRDSINEESVVPAPKEGEGYSTGRGGGGNVHPAGAPEKTNGVSSSKGNVAKLGLADKLKYMIFRKKAPVA